MNEKLYTILDPYLSDQPPFLFQSKGILILNHFKKNCGFFRYSGKEPFKSQSFISLEGPFNEYFLVVYQ